MTERLTHAAENAHWYDPNTVQPVYEVPNAKGDRLIKPDVRHARKLGLVPGVTAIISMLAKPGLVNWQLEQAIWAALTLPRDRMETDQEFLQRILKDGQRQRDEAAEEGTRIHAAAQDFFEKGYLTLPHEPYAKHVEGIVRTIEGVCGEQAWQAERCCVHPLGYGTKADLSCPSWVIDFKGKEFDDSGISDLRLWDNHHMQLAATREALAETIDPEFEDARALIIYVSRTVPGLAYPIEAKADDLDRGWGMFQAAHRLWCLQRRYEPGRVTAA